VPDHFSARYGRGVAHIRKSQFNSSITDLNEAIRLNPKHASARNNRAIAYLKSGKPELALSDLNVAIQINPENALAYYNRGVVLSEISKFEEASADLLAALRLDPNNPEFNNQLAWIYLKIGSPALGIRYASRAITLSPKTANFYDTRASLHESIGRLDDALNDYKRALQLDSKLSTSVAGLQRLQQSQQDQSHVPELFSKLIALAKQYGWIADLSRSCVAMQLNTETNCKFKQISVSVGAPGQLNDYGFNVPAYDADYVVLFHLTPLVGHFFVVNHTGEVQASYYRARGVDFTRIPTEETQTEFDQNISFWRSNLDRLRENLLKR
jgi:tetratricopeptide (TPR) repeat protein